MTRQELIGRFFLLTETLLPADAGRYGYVIMQPLAFQRVLLDFAFDDAWENHLDRRKAFYDQLNDEQLEYLVSLAEYMLSGGADRIAEMNEQSLAWRGKG